MKFKLFIFTCIFISLFLPFFSFNSFSKYQFENTFLVAKVQIDNSPPEIKLISFSNSNTSYPKFANHTHTITAKVKVIEEHVSSINLDPEHIKVKVANQFVSVKFNKISCISSNSKEKIYEIVFTNIPKDGLLSLYFTDECVIDTSSQSNHPKTFPSNILIDNTSPTATFSEEVIESNFSKGTIKVNESIQPVNDWDISSNNMELSRKFPNPVEYELPIKDFAQNSASVLISIKNASNFNIEYSIYEPGTNDFYPTSNGSISGKHLINSDSICKTEALFIRTFGNIDSSSLKGKAFVYTYGGDGSSGTCKYSELRYNYGYNPLSSLRTINKEHTAYVNGNLFTEFGGTGLNYSGSGPNSLPEEIAKQYLFGVSSISLSLDDYSKYSVVYQIYVKNVGWLSAKSNGQEAIYKFDKPFSAIRINLVPSSQKDYLINYWNKDIN